MGDEHGGLLEPDFMRRVVDLDMPLMARFFAVERVTDSAVWRRLAALEYLGTWLGGRLA
jgi:asparagine synthase (glutamine-hydrolysing)